MSVTFTKLFSSITESTVWAESDHTRLVWITMLAMADKNGRVWASIPGLANRARVPIESAEEALRVFMSPDKYSRTDTFEGRRIEKIDGGWMLLNHRKYREIRDEIDRAERKAKNQAEYRTRNKRSRVTDSDNALPPVAKVTARDHNAEADTEAITPISPFNVSPEMVAKEGLKAAGITSDKVFNQVCDQMRLISPDGFSDDEADKMIEKISSSWKSIMTAFSQGKLTHTPWGAEKFFGDGYWDKPETWPWERGAGPQVKRVYVGVER